MNPFTIKTGGINRKIMEFVTSERHPIGNYKRCAYEYEELDLKSALVIEDNGLNRFG